MGADHASGTSAPCILYPSPHTPHDQQLVEEMRFVELFTTSLAENGGILAASALMSFGRVGLTPGQPPNHSAIWINAGGQVRGGAWRIAGLGEGTGLDQVILATCRTECGNGAQDSGGERPPKDTAAARIQVWIALIDSIWSSFKITDSIPSR